MIDLQEIKWKEFEVQSIFDVTRGNAKNVTKRKFGGDVALVSATDKNNAFYDFVTPNKNETIYKNTMTIHNNGNGVGLAFYHNYKFIATSDVTILLDKTGKINKEIAEFIIVALQKQKEKYCYGYKLSNERLKKQKILLPILDDGTINYNFMENYISEIKAEKMKKYNNYIQKELKTLNSLGGVTLHSLKSHNWKEIVIGDLFDVVIGKAIDGNKVNREKGKTAYITRKENNNGIDGFIDYDFKFLNSYGNVITIGNETAEPFVQSYSFYTGTKVNILIPKKPTNKYVLLFIAQSLKMHKSKYSYSYTINSTRLKKQAILLPMDATGNIDYKYMENYIKSIIFNKINTYLNLNKLV